MIVHYDGSGQHVWHRVLGTPTGYTNDISLTPAFENWIVGSTTVGTIDLGSGPVATGVGRAYLLKLGR